MNDQGYVDSCDYMAKIGAEKGDGRSWKIIWDADPNKALKTKRKNPYMLFKGDQFLTSGAPQITKGDKVVVDPAALGLAQGSTENTIASVKKALPKTELRLKILDENREPAKKWKYKLKIGADSFEGETKDDGTIEVELKSLEATAGELVITEKKTTTDAEGAETVTEGKPVKLKVHVGKLNPISDAEAGMPDKGVSGVQARLLNLDFGCGKVDGQMGPLTRSAMVRFLKLIKVKTEDANGKLLSDAKLLGEARKGLEKHHDRKTDFPKPAGKKTPPPVPPRPGTAAKKTPPPVPPKAGRPPSGGQSGGKKAPPPRPPKPGAKKTPPPVPPKAGRPPSAGQTEAKKTPPPRPPKPGAKKTPPPVPPKAGRPPSAGQTGAKKTPPPLPPRPGARKTPPPLPPKPKKPGVGGA